jgi:hypothetical protein
LYKIAASSPATAYNPYSLGSRLPVTLLIHSEPLHREELLIEAEA